MDTAKNVRLNVKVDKYFLTEDSPELAGAVRDTMTLFKIEVAADSVKAMNNFESSIRDLNFSKSCVMVENKICYDNNDTDKNMVKVKTKIYFYFNNSLKGGNKTALGDNQPEFLEMENHAEFSLKEDGVIIAKRLARLNVLGLMRQITGINPSPWGILRGVRPTKIVHRLLDKGLKRPETIEVLTSDYGIDDEKAALITDISIYQRSLLAEPKESKKIVSVYIGVPYCPSRCLYCSFPSFAMPLDRGQLEDFLAALKTDIEAAGRVVSETGLKVETIYIGGGTPTSLEAKDLAKLLELANKNFGGNQTREFTLEAGRPDSIDTEKARIMREFGVTRASINPQTMQEKTLCSIGRKHTVTDIIGAFHKIRQAEIKVINMDVIAGLPGETEFDMIDTMTQIEKLEPENITVHTLAIKRGSLLKTDLIQTSENKKMNLPSEDITRNMLKIAGDYAIKMGMRPYYLYRQKYMTGNLENVGYAKPGAECFYNIQIIGERQSIIGIGPAAGTKVVNPLNWQLQSCYNAKDVLTYIKNLQIYIDARNNLLGRLF